MTTEFLYEKYVETGKVSTDTRLITPGSVFFALKGPNFNANEFGAEALKKGASYVVVDEPKWSKGDKYLLVEDALLALQALARHHRSQFSIPFIALTGSNGKTTTKELINEVLTKKFKTVATKGNLNNHIGVPLTLLEVDASTEIAIIEMGANHLGEIASLCEIANPTHGIITNIGKAHIGTFGGFENIVRGKSELYQYLINHEGKVWINSQNEILANMSKRFKDPLMYPSSGDFYQCKTISANPFLTIEAENGEEVKTQLVGDYNFENIAAALCIGKYFGVPPELANQSIRDYNPGNMRSQLKKKGTNDIILDAYNANPTSMEAAIRNLIAMKATHKVAIIGDMYELDSESESEHAKIGKVLLESDIDEILLCGLLMRVANHQDSRFRYFENKAQLNQYLAGHKWQSSLILIKASRGMALESVAELL